MQCPERNLRVREWWCRVKGQKYFKRRIFLTLIFYRETDAEAELRLGERERDTTMIGAVL